MTDEERASLDGFARAVRATNPFRVNRVSRPDELFVDVSDIHGREFGKLLVRVEEARAGAASGVLLTGIAGCGKSHVIARLCRWANAGTTVAPVFLHNLQASPERMPRYVLKATMSSLSTLRAPGGVLDGLRTVLAGGIPKGTEALEAEILAALTAWLALLDRPDDADLAEAAVGWLSGEELDPDQTAQLTAIAGRPSMRAVLPDAAAVERVLLVVARLLARDGRVLLLCLDQIDNLDHDQVGALTAFLHALLDHADHLLVICSGVTSTMAKLKDEAISEAAWDRVAQYTVDLQEVTRDQAQRLLEARMGVFLGPFTAPEVTAARADAMFPLGQGWFDARFTELQFKPRDAITRARDAWESVQDELAEIGVPAWFDARTSGGRLPHAVAAPTGTLEDAIREGVRLKIEERRAERELNPASLPPDTDNLSTLVLTLLQVCAGWPGYSLVSVSRELKPKKGNRTFDLIARERSGEREILTGILCLPGGHGRQTTDALKRVKLDRRSLDHLLLTSDERSPVQRRRGTMGNEYLTELETDAARQFRHLRLEPPDVAQLDALVSVLGLARVGDLEVEYPRGTVHAVTEAEAIAAMHALDVFRAHPLLRELLTEDHPPPAPPPSPSPLDDETVQTLIAGYLSWRVGASAAEVAGNIAEVHGVADAEALLAQVIRVADGMHRRGLVVATPQDEDRYLLLVGGPA